MSLLLALALQASPAATSPVQAPRRPNVLLLYADDLGYGDLGVQNAASKIPTPHLDRLASEGLRFTDGHSSSGICTPSRYALLTGRYHWRDFHEIVGPFGASKFAAERLTLPELLRAEGYDTACIGKWHLGWDWDAVKKEGAQPTRRGQQDVWGPDAFDWTRPIPDGPLAHGFDHYFGDTVINFPPYCWIEDDRVVEPPDTFLDTASFGALAEGTWECRAGPMITGWDPFDNLPTLTRKGVAYLRGRAEQSAPFFLYLAFPSPHAPIVPTAAFDGRSEAGPYGDYVAQTDAACGALLAALAESGLADDTLVIFSSDNGPERYAYARDERFEHWSAAPFRGTKRDVYEGGHHVPFLVRWPGVVEAGRTSGALVSQIDVMATLASVLGAALPDDAAEDSHDLLPLFTGERDAVRTSHVHNTYAGQFALREGDWLLVDAPSGYVGKRNAAWEARHGVPPDDDAPVELYDLSADIGQRRNLAAEQPERVAALQARLRDLRERGHSAPRLR